VEVEMKIDVEVKVNSPSPSGYDQIYPSGSIRDFPDICEASNDKYTPRLLDSNDDDNPCSGRCDLVLIEGLLLYELPVPPCE
jgi:hypothetical protein